MREKYHHTPASSQMVSMEGWPSGLNQGANVLKINVSRIYGVFNEKFVFGSNGVLTSVERHHQPIYLLPLLHKLVTKYFPTGQVRDTTVGVYIYKTQQRCAVLDQCWGFLYSTIRFGVTVQYHLKRLSGHKTHTMERYQFGNGEPGSRHCLGSPSHRLAPQECLNALLERLPKRSSYIRICLHILHCTNF